MEKSKEKKTDPRIKKTKKAIFNAFITLRAEKPLSKISVKELADLAFINKATFYLHYKDIYDLSDTLEDAVISQVLQAIEAPELLLSDPAAGTRNLFKAFNTQGQLCHILFSGDRFDMFVKKIDLGVKEYIFKKYPEKRNDLNTNIVLTMCNYGAFHAFELYSDHYKSKNTTEVIEIISDATAALFTLLN